MIIPEDKRCSSGAHDMRKSNSSASMCRRHLATFIYMTVNAEALIAAMPYSGLT